MKKLILYFMTLLPFLLLTGCSTIDEPDDEVLFEELGAYAFGPLLDVEIDELIQFEYVGEEIRIPYRVEGHAQGITSEFGWFLLVDALPQLTRLETFEGEILSEEAYMHHFALDFSQWQDFYVILQPSHGEAGTRVGMIAGALLRPDFMPENLENPSFDIFHALTATIPAEILIERNTVNSARGYTHTELESIPEEVIVLEEASLQEGESFEEILVQFPRIGLFPKESELDVHFSGIIPASGGQVDLRMFVYGGHAVTSRITLFVNHQPVQVNGADFVEIEMEVGQIAVVDLTLYVDELFHFNSLYAIMMTTGEDYLIQDIAKTRTLLLVNESEEMTR